MQDNLHCIIRQARLHNGETQAHRVTVLYYSGLRGIFGTNMVLVKGVAISPEKGNEPLQRSCVFSASKRCTYIGFIQTITPRVSHSEQKESKPLSDGCGN